MRYAGVTGVKGVACCWIDTSGADGVGVAVVDDNIVETELIKS